MTILRKSMNDRFDSHVSPEPNTGCFLWTAGVTSTGYGKFAAPGRQGGTLLAHRFAWERDNGPIPVGMVVRHLKCNQRSCVNTEHMALGTHADNSADMTRQGRQARGEKQHLAKLSADDVVAIRALHATGSLSQESIASRYSIAQTGVSKIVNRETWKHI